MEKILVVDDDPAIQRLLEMVLRRGGYEVMVAKDGLEGWEIAQKQTPALIICDWLMPGLTGLGLCQRVKQTPAIATTFFILLTARTSSQDRVAGLDAGADDFLFKPVEVNELQARVRAGLRLYHLNQDLHEQKYLLEKELKEAADYVASLLPKPVDYPHLTVKTLYRPSQKLGGDAYDYFWLDETHFVFYLLDVSGHGMGATLPALSVINFLRSQKLPKQDYYQPEQILGELNHNFPMGTSNKYFTIWYGVYDTATKQLTYASAGHPPGILSLSLKPNEPIHFLKSQGFPIGIFSNSNYHSKEIAIEPGMTLYLYSDGLYDITFDHNRASSLEKLQSFLHYFQQQQGKELEEFFLKNGNFFPVDRQKDDISLVQLSFL